MRNKQRCAPSIKPIDSVLRSSVREIEPAIGYIYTRQSARADRRSFARLTIANVKSLTFEEACYLCYVRGDTRAWSG